MNTTTANRTGHLAMFQAVTAVSPRPTAEPTAPAIGPVRTSDTRTSASSTTSTSVTSICSGRSLMNERPSSTS